MSVARPIRLGALPEGELLTFLDRARRTMWLRRLMSASIRSGWIALIPVVALVSASKVLDIEASTPRLLLAFALPFGAALLAQMWGRPTRYHAARQVDHQLHLQERLTTALELQTSAGGYHPLARAQLEDAVGRIRTVDLFEAVPFRLPKRHAVALVALLGVAGILAVAPSFRRPPPPSDALAQKSIAQEAKRLEQLAKEVTPLQADGQLTREQTAAIAALQSLQQANPQQGMTREDALAKLSDAEAQLRLQQSGTAADTQQALEKAASVLATDPTTRDLAQSLTSGKPADTASRLQQLAQAATGMSQDQRDKLAATMRASGAQAAKSDPSVGQALQRAGDAAASTDATQRSQAFDQTSTAVQQAQVATGTQAQVQRALSQVQASQQAISQAGQQGPPSGSQSPGAQSSEGQQGQQAGQLGDQQGQQADQQGQPGQTGARQGQGAQAADASSGAASQSQGASTDGQSAASGQPGAQGQAGNQAQAGGQAGGQAQAQGQGQGQGNQASQGAGQGQSGGQGQGAGARGAGGGQGESVYDPKSVPTHQVQVNGQQSASGRQQVEQGAGPQDPTSSQALVPYSQLYQQYKQQASDTMDSSYIPLNMKDLVRDYFTSLAPSK